MDFHTDPLLGFRSIPYSQRVILYSCPNVGASVIVQYGDTSILQNKQEYRREGNSSHSASE